MSKPTYRAQFDRPAKADEYDDVHLAAGSYSDLLWEIEQRQLTEIVESFRRTHPRIDLLDFAAGTGRIIAFLEQRVDSATGIDVSAAMVERAAGKLTGGTMICKDITDKADEIEGRYDLITAFRFVLNAEPALRIAAFRALAARLRDRSSVLVFNNHGNPWSHKLPVWPYHRLRRIGAGYRTEGNYMTGREARRLADEAGLTIERVLGCGLLSAKSLRLWSYDRVLRWEHRLARGLPARWGVNQIYVACLK